MRNASRWPAELTAGDVSLPKGLNLDTVCSCQQCCTRSMHINVKVFDWDGRCRRRPQTSRASALRASPAVTLDPCVRLRGVAIRPRRLSFAAERATLTGTHRLDIRGGNKNSAYVDGSDIFRWPAILRRPQGAETQVAV